MRYLSASATTIVAALIPLAAFSSSHREAPNIAGNPRVDSTDVYSFMSYEPGREEYVTLLANYLPLQDPYGGPNYFALDEAAVYEIHIDNDGDARENLTFQFRFDNDLGGNRARGLKVPVGPAGTEQNVAVPLKNIGGVAANSDNAQTLNFRESYTLTLVRGDRRRGDEASVRNSSTGDKNFGKPYDFVGTKTFGSIDGYDSYANQFIYTVDIPGCSKQGRVFVGQRNEPFVVNLGPVFDLINFVPIEGDSAPGAGDGKGFPGGITQSDDNDIISDKNITTLALEVHKSCLVGSGNGVIGVWTSASLPQVRVLNPRATFEVPDVNAGALTQVSRLGMPLVNEVVIGLPDKDRYSASEPKDDGQFLSYVTNPTLPFLIDALFRKAVNGVVEPDIANLAPNNFPRDDLKAAFLTGLKLPDGTNVNQLARVTASEMQRLNTGIAPTAKDKQSTFGVAGGDLAGFPNGRRPGDDVVDIELRVAMGALCHLQLGLCSPANAPVGNQPITDGAPISAADFDNKFPYLTTPIPGAVGPMSSTLGSR
jgi:uncharacterized protein DUF4331